MYHRLRITHGGTQLLETACRRYILICHKNKQKVLRERARAREKKKVEEKKDKKEQRIEPHFYIHVVYCV